MTLIAALKALQHCNTGLVKLLSSSKKKKVSFCVKAFAYNSYSTLRLGHFPHCFCDDYHIFWSIYTTVRLFCEFL